MAATLGTFFIVASLVCVGFSILSLLASLKLKSQILTRNARWLTWGSIFFTLAAFVTLEVALFSRDYSIRYVYEHTANSVSGLFTFTAAWAGLVGSLLLWTLVLCGYTAYVLFSTRTKKGETATYNPTLVIAHMVMCGFIFYFLLMITVASSPFDQVTEVATNGLGANPLLQDHYAMAIHPPMLYIGYVGFVVPFAYVIGSLITKDFSNMSTTRVRRTSMIAWVFLTAGIILGAWWSYEVLGWGGYWAWDPVENASLLPWLTATAFIHSTIMQSKRGMLRGWNYTVVIATCALTILGTFLTRSGIVNSVHSFTQSNIGGWLLTLFAIVVIGGAGLLIWRFDDVKSEKTIKGASKKETMFLLNNIVFCIFALVVLLGTTYPLIADSLRGEQVSVGTPYYEKFSVPLGFSILLLMGMAPMVAFAETKVAINERLRVPSVFGLIFAGVAVFVGQHVLTAAAVGMTTFVVVGGIMILYKTVKQSGKRVLLERPRKVGAMIVHIGIALIGLSIVLSTHTWDAEATLVKNKEQVVGPYTLTYVSSSTESSEDVIETSVGIRIVREGDELGVYAPKIRTYPARNMSVGTPSVHTSVLRDTYLTVISTPTGDEVVIKVAQNPAVVYIWISGFIIVIGSIITLLPQRRKADKLPGVRPPETDKTHDEVSV
jgi:cytochrome c-type biogenesis protein CcmF